MRVANVGGRDIPQTNLSERKTMNITRRDLLKLGTCGSVLGVAGAAFPKLAVAATKKLPVALELWSVRDEAEKDLARVLAAAAEMGYQGVELCMILTAMTPRRGASCWTRMA